MPDALAQLERTLRLIRIATVIGMPYGLLLLWQSPAISIPQFGMLAAVSLAMLLVR